MPEQRPRMTNLTNALQGLHADRLQELRAEAMQACGPWRDDVGRYAEYELAERQYTKQEGAR